MFLSVCQGIKWRMNLARASCLLRRQQRIWASSIPDDSDSLRLCSDSTVMESAMLPYLPPHNPCFVSASMKKGETCLYSVKKSWRSG